MLNSGGDGEHLAGGEGESVPGADVGGEVVTVEVTDEVAADGDTVANIEVLTTTNLNNEAAETTPE